jgi:hypothetical protein
MTDNSIFYYPYAFFSDNQLPMLKAAALYFDEIYLLDPSRASMQGGIIDMRAGKKSGFFSRIRNKLVGADSNQHFEGDAAKELTEAIRILEKEEKILKRIRPEEILHKYEKDIAEAIRSDMNDPKFVLECRSSDIKKWKLALAKVPKDIRNDPRYKSIDEAMGKVMGDIPKSLQQGGYLEGYFEGYDEQTYIEGEAGQIEYRFGEYPIELGESIMINHALFGGLLYKEATPLTDEYFHNRILNLKIERANSMPQIRQILDNIERTRQVKKNQLALTTLRDIDLAIIPPELPFQKIIEYRHDHEKELENTRQELGNLARTIKETPWSKEFADKLETEIIPNKLYPNLAKGKESQKSWLSKHKKEIVQIGSTAAAIGITITAGVPVDIPSLITSSATIATSGMDMIGKGDQNGFHYLMNIKENKT